MDTSVIKSGFKTVGQTLAKNSPFILSGLAVIGVIATSILAVKATPKAEKLIEKKKRDSDKPITYGDAVKVAWKPYWPAALSGCATIACIIGSNTILVKRIDVLTSACVLTERAYSEYKAKVKEELGEKKEKKIEDAIKQDKVEKAYVTSRPIVYTGKGDSLYMEEMTGQIFRSNRTAIDKAVNECTAQLQTYDCVDYSTFLRALGLTPTILSDNVEWTSDRCKKIEPIWSYPIYGGEGDGEPCGVISFDPELMSMRYRDHYYA